MSHSLTVLSKLPWRPFTVSAECHSVRAAVVADERRDPQRALAVGDVPERRRAVGVADGEDPPVGTEQHIVAGRAADGT